MAASALAVSLQAQTLPSPVYSIDFEGVSSAQDLGAELVGAGLFLQSEDQNFGTYYQNNPEGVIASHQNYLIIPTAAFVDCQAKSNEQFSIAFWMNGYVANEKQGTDANGHYYSTAIAAYSQANSYKTFSWPMFSARTRRTLQINCNGWSDYTPEENVNGANVESNEWIWTKQVETGETDEEGNPVMGPSSFEENWHYVTITFNGLNAKYYVDGEIMNEWNATANSYNFVTAMNALDAIYLGDCGPFWQDKDGAYFLYEMACSEEDSKKLTPGTKIKVTGTKGAWAGEIEIMDATFEFVESEKWVAEATDVTALLGTDDLIKHQNKVVTFKGMKVEKVEFKNNQPGDDIYVTVSKDGKSYDFCVEFYLTNTETEVYKTVSELKEGDMVGIVGFLYWYQGVNTHITAVKAAA